MRMAFVGLLLVLALVLSGCASHKMPSSEARMMGAGAAMELSGKAARPKSDRMIVWNASLSIDVWSISNAVRETLDLTSKAGGYVESKTERGEERVDMIVRLPADAFKESLSVLEQLGTVTYRSMGGEDVTEQYIDVQARLKNKYVLRDRLKQLLEKAVTVQEILAIETEMNRVQSDIDSMEGRIKSLQGQVQYATLNLDLTRKKILGPLGYVFKGLWWGVEKLFVIRD
jgi:hypothetical protein